MSASSISVRVADSSKPTTLKLAVFNGRCTLAGVSNRALRSSSASLSALPALPSPGTSRILPPAWELFILREAIPKAPKRILCFARISTLAYVHPALSDPGGRVIVTVAERGGQTRLGKVGGDLPPFLTSGRRTGP